MDGETFAFIFAIIVSAALMFMSVFYLIVFADLESGYISAATCCDRVNKIVFPEVGLIAFLSLCLLYFKCYGSLVFTTPMFVWLLYRIAKKPAGHMSFYDPAEIHNRNALKNYSRESVVKVVYHVVGFFVYLYSIISSILSDGGADLSDLHQQQAPFIPKPPL
ncbi:protein cornichon homolog 4-like [Clytia hemisphaerica]|uniref:Uncharacterized protein n=1 Tax=Clytia hemisphaerica TaxID=252671 RepID=A0A7M5X179_9CNID